MTEDLPETPLKRTSINYIQALPGTPVYEYARNRGLIGATLESEERYLDSISDVNAADDSKFLNFTEHDYLTVQSWRLRMTIDVLAHYKRRRHVFRPGVRDFVHLLASLAWPRRPRPPAEGDSSRADDYSQGGYFNLRRGLAYDLAAGYLYPLRNLVICAWVITAELRRAPFGVLLSRLGEFVRMRTRVRKRQFAGYRSLRSVVEDGTPQFVPLTFSDQAMKPLRRGR